MNNIWYVGEGMPLHNQSKIILEGRQRLILIKQKAMK